MKCKCLKCGHVWETRTDNKPLCCPACKSYRYERPNPGMPEKKEESHE